MKKYKLATIFISFLTFLSCDIKNKGTGQKGQNSVSYKSDSNKVINLDDTFVITKQEFNDAFYRKLIIGIWGEDINENASFVIEKDSTRYLDNGLIPYYYFIRNDSFIVEIEDEFYSAKILKLDKDSLLLSSDGYISSYVRFKR